MCHKPFSWRRSHEAHYELRVYRLCVDIYINAKAQLKPPTWHEPPRGYPNANNIAHIGKTESDRRVARVLAIRHRKATVGGAAAPDVAHLAPASRGTEHAGLSRRDAL